MRAGRLVLLALTLVASACGRRAPGDTPEGAARELVDRMRRVHGDAEEAKAVFELLSKRAQDNLTERATRYTNASGKSIAPEAMIAPSRFLLRFEPQRYHARVVGAHALVEVTGLMPDDRAVVPCVFEGEAWRVDLALPPLPAIRTRPGTEP
jgi:hypothetical protein